MTTEESLDELAELVRSAGGDVAGRTVQRRDRPDPATFVGGGKLAEIEARRVETGADLVIFDDELSPAQLRNIERVVQSRVLDRTALILDIFALRARTAEAELQVELAQLEYLLPRLAGRGRDLSRLGGGIGTRGPGETKLETDRRRIRRRISDLRRKIEAIRRHRALHRQRRQAAPLPVVALVGYTNAGKSTLMNACTAAGVLAEDKLFATLDPTTRRWELPGGAPVLLSDTVGFLRKLPHGLVAAFRATLEEVAEADLLLHVIDVSHPHWPDHVTAVRRVLEEIGADRRPVLPVLNKIDRLGQGGGDGGTATAALRDVPDAVLVSALTGQGLDELARRVAAALASRRVTERFSIPYRQADLVATLHREGRVVNAVYGDDAIEVEVDVERAWADRIRARLDGSATAAHRAPPPG